MFITKSYQLKLNREIIAVRSENYTKYLQCAGKNADFFNLTSDGAYSYQCALNNRLRIRCFEAKTVRRYVSNLHAPSCPRS
jgi:hypothetical protein